MLTRADDPDALTWDEHYAMGPTHEEDDKVPRKSFAQALQDGYKIPEFSGESFSYRFGPCNRYELAFEPLLFGQWYVALYDGYELLTDKVPVRPGGRADE